MSVPFLRHWYTVGGNEFEATTLKVALPPVFAVWLAGWVAMVGGPNNVNVTGTGADFNQALEQAGRVADFLEFGELLCRDALARRESCGGHFRTEYQTDDGEARRDDENFSHVAAWEYQGDDRPPIRHEEPLVYEEIKMSQRSYK